MAQKTAKFMVEVSTYVIVEDEEEGSFARDLALAKAMDIGKWQTRIVSKEIDGQRVN